MRRGKHHPQSQRPVSNGEKWWVAVLVIGLAMTCIGKAIQAIAELLGSMTTH